MRYVCSIYGYIYDEKRKDISFSQLSDAWTCPLCEADRSLPATEQKVEKTAGVAIRLERID